MAEARERTFIMIKPDGVHRGLVGKIIKRFEAKGFKLVAMKFMWVSTKICNTRLYTDTGTVKKMKARWIDTYCNFFCSLLCGRI